MQLAVWGQDNQEISLLKSMFVDMNIPTLHLICQWFAAMLENTC